MEPPTKRARLLDDSDSDSDSDSDAFAVKTETQSSSLTINEGFAKRFEHNKKREEKHRRRCLCDLCGGIHISDMTVSGGKIR